MRVDFQDNTEPTASMQPATLETRQSNSQGTQPHHSNVNSPHNAVSPDEIHFESATATLGIDSTVISQPTPSAVMLVPLLTDSTLQLQAGLDTQQVSSSAWQEVSNTGGVRCWQHGCNGRTFTSLGNYRRHCKERNGMAGKTLCPVCARSFSRLAAMKVHLKNRRCKLICSDESGVLFEQPLMHFGQEQKLVRQEPIEEVELEITGLNRAASR